LDDRQLALHMPRPVTLNVLKAFKRSFVKDALRAALVKVKEVVDKLDCPIPCMLLEIESYLLPCCLPRGIAGLHCSSLTNHTEGNRI
jgi:hypothetical protein